MEKKLAVPAIAIILGLAVAAFAFSGMQQKGLVVEGTLIDAGRENPYELFASIASKQVFIVSPEMNERTAAVDHEMFNGTALFLQVLEGNNRKAIQVVRVYDESKNLEYCITNYGDTNRSETLEKGECLDYISGSSGFPVLIQFPDSSLAMPKLEVSQEKLVVRPSSQGNIGDASFLALEIMFKNSRDIIEASNLIVKKLNARQ